MAYRIKYRKGFGPFFCFSNDSLRILVLLFVSYSAYSQGSSGIDSRISFRGLSVVTDSVAWVSGSKSAIFTTKDGAKTWSKVQIPDCENCDLRTCYAFDSRRVLVANAGSPARIFFTDSRGKTWKTVFSNPHPEAFIDGMDFWDEDHGICFGDPIDGQMLVLGSADGGKSWKPVANSPRLDKGEASFAASGTTISCQKDGSVWIATGGAKSRLWVSADTGKTWKDVSVPILQGQSSQGIFSFEFSKMNRLLVVGGDYLVDSLSKNHVFYSDDQGKTWTFPQVPTRGYRECVCFWDETTCLAIGPSGIDYSTRAGEYWKPFPGSITGYHVVRKARNGSLIVMAGGKGQLGKTSLNQLNSR